MSAIPFYTKQVITYVEPPSPVTQASYTREDFSQSNAELKKTVDFLMARVQHLEAAKAEQSVNGFDFSFLNNQ